MAKNVLLTGAPGSGKTTAVREILARLERPAGGFYTEELRGESGRYGFRLVTLDGQEGVLAGFDLPSHERVGRYKVDVRVLETLGVSAIRGALAAHAVVVIDEIGPMEALARSFRTAVIEALEGPQPVLATIVKSRHPFADIVKARRDVVLLTVTRDNREQVLARALQSLQAAGG